ncbi:hypothetical protein Csa_023878, partial [Cucumis sativus]
TDLGKSGDNGSKLHDCSDDCTIAATIARLRQIRRGPRRLGLRQIGAETANCKDEAQPALRGWR